MDEKEHLEFHCKHPTILKFFSQFIIIIIYILIKIKPCTTSYKNNTNNYYMSVDEKVELKVGMIGIISFS